MRRVLWNVVQQDDADGMCCGGGGGGKERTVRVWEAHRRCWRRRSCVRLDDEGRRGCIGR